MIQLNDLPQTLCVEVTQDDINNAGSDEYNCPIALAITRQLNLPPAEDLIQVGVANDDIKVHTYSGMREYLGAASYEHTLQSAAFVTFYDLWCSPEVRFYANPYRHMLKPARLCLKRRHAWH